MSSSVLVTKLSVHPPRPNVVPRPQLIERLNEGQHHELTLISAPAGFGKTTLLSTWARGGERPAAWLSLDEGDNDLARFLAHLIAALQTVAPHIGAGVLGVIHAPQPPPAEAILVALVNDISAVADPFVLVLDDYHLIDAEPVDRALAFLIEHLPAQMHLVISTRQDPPLPLARMRARDQLTELRAADLRFAPDETAAFLNQAMGLNLSAADIAALEERTEGWVAGLQLAALSLRGRPDPSGFIQTFTGDHRYIVDYLVDEVLRRQSAPIRSFLLQTAILDRLHGSLCDAVTGQQDGAARLESLARGNFFIVPLDDQRQWYRYHHLFADVLRVHLHAEYPDEVATLHQRVSEWYERRGSVADAIHHALAARDFERTADLVERAWPVIRRNRQETTMLSWLKALPAEVIRRRPVLSVIYAHVLLSTGNFDGVETLLRDAEHWLNLATDTRREPETLADGMVVVDDREFRRLPGAIAVARAGQALARGDVPETETHARQAIDLVPDDDHLSRGAAAALLGLAYWTRGNLEAAHRAYADGMARIRLAGNIPDTIGGAVTLADIRIAQGRLGQAMRTYQQGLKVAAEHGEPEMRGTADMHVGMSELHREHGDLHAATQHLLRSSEQGDHTGFPQYPYRWRVAMARIQQARGDLDTAVDLLDEAEGLYAGDFSPNVRPVAAIRARVWVKQGRLDEALDWARERSLSVDDELSYLREFEHITLARVLLAQGTGNHAHGPKPEIMEFLDRLLQAAEAGGRTGNVIEILILQALAHQACRDIPAALASLERALTLAEPEGYVRIFVDEGLPMAARLEASAKRGIAPNYVRRLLAAFGEAEDRPPANQNLIEPLSERELHVLRLLGTDLDGPEIARELMVSLNTMRTHTKNIYSKLGVNNRRAAVRRSEELGLLPRTRNA